jgi:hypothetical protein
MKRGTHFTTLKEGVSCKRKEESTLKRQDLLKRPELEVEPQLMLPRFPLRMSWSLGLGLW